MVIQHLKQIGKVKRLDKCGFYTSGDDQLSGWKLRRSSKSLPEAKLAAKNGHGHCLVVCCQSDPLQLSESQ